MSDVEIQTPRGLVLSGTFVHPVDATDAAVLFSHSLLHNRHSGQYFDRLGRYYRANGYATLEFDYSGHGASSDNIITLEHCVEDLRAASGWLHDQGFSRQILHGHAFGALSALAAKPKAVETMVLSELITGPVSYDWDAIFSAVQLEELEEHGVTTIPDDSPGTRQNFTISKQTLADLSLVNSDAILSGLNHPVLVIHDQDDIDMGLLDMTQQHFARFPDGSKVEVFRDVHCGADQTFDVLADVCVNWAKTHVPVLR